ncbi:MAG: branched-chain amino acid ABC transporter permease [Treponema sp.]|nr:branched-chain amino acid ABC transporter permease [Treponema sp.]
MPDTSNEGRLGFPVKSTLILSIVAVFAVTFPILLRNLGVLSTYWVFVLTLGGVNAIMAISVNTIVGITGQLSLGQAGFLAIGAYSYIFFHADVGLPLPLAAFFAVLLTGIAGFLIGFPVLKLSGDYLAVVTLGFGEIIRVVANNLSGITWGPNGRTFLTPLLFNRPLGFIVITVTLIVVLVLVQNFLRSSYGRAIKACREDEIAAESSGVNIFRYKMTGFVIAAVIAGIGGCLFAMVIGIVLPMDANFLRSIDYLIFVVFGGMGSMTGAILAAYALTILQEFLQMLPRAVQDLRLIVYALVLILIMIFRPRGLLGMTEFSFVQTWDRLAGFVKGKARGVKGEAA